MQEQIAGDFEQAVALEEDSSKQSELGTRDRCRPGSRRAQASLALSLVEWSGERGVPLGQGIWYVFLFYSSFHDISSAPFNPRTCAKCDAVGDRVTSLNAFQSTAAAARR
jgi:hypothetical protein